MSKTPFCATSEQDQAAMFASLGIESFDDLFEGIPDHLRSHTMDIPQGLSEMEMMQHLRRVASKNATGLVNFCGVDFMITIFPPLCRRWRVAVNFTQHIPRTNPKPRKVPCRLRMNIKRRSVD